MNKARLLIAASVLLASVAFASVADAKSPKYSCVEVSPAHWVCTLVMRP